MLARPHHKTIAAPSPVSAVVPLVLGPASSAVAAFRVTGGVLMVSPLIGAPIELFFDPQEDPDRPHAWSYRDAPDRTFALRITEKILSPEHDTAVQAVHLTTYDVDFLNTAYEIEIVLSDAEEPIPDHFGALTETGRPGVYDIEQNIGLQVVVSTVRRSLERPQQEGQKLAVACVFNLQVALTGTYVGTINPTVGTATVNGGGVLLAQKERTSDVLLARLFNDRPVICRRLVFTTP